MLSLSFPGNVLKAVVHFLYGDEVRAIKGVFGEHTHARTHARTHTHTIHGDMTVYFFRL